MPESDRAAAPAFATTDLCDANEALLLSGELRVLPPVYRTWGRRLRFSGPVATVRCFEANALVRAALEAPGDGRVLVVDGGGSLRCALFGGNLAVLAEKNDWAGVIIEGCLRDADEIDACRIGVRALASHPRRSDRRAVGDREAVLELHGIRIAPGQWCYADADGILISNQALHR